MDEFGFPIICSEESLQKYMTEVLPRRAALEDKWFEFIRQSGGSMAIDIKNEKFKNLVRLGVPSDHRAIIWGKLAGVFKALETKQGLYPQFLSIPQAIPQAIAEAISLDVPRTFPRATCFTPEQLTNVLKAFAVAHPEIGYCQGLSFIAAVSLSVFRDEEQAFWLLCNFVEKYMPPQYFTPTMSDFQVDLCLIGMLIDERTPELSKLAAKIGHNWIQNTSGWLLTAFSNSLPMSTVLRVWDSFILEGPKVLFRVAISILRLAQTELLTQTTSSGFMTCLTQFQKNLVDQDQLMETGFAIKAFSRDHLFDMRVQASKIVSEKGIPSEVSSKHALQSFLGQLNL